MICSFCKKEIKVKSGKKGLIRCPFCHSSFPEKFGRELTTFDDLKFEEISFAPQVLIEQYEDIANHFIPRILGITEFLITDESSLLDFNFKIVDEEIAINTKEDLKKIKEIYGVDVSDIEDFNLIKIFERLRILSPVFNT